MTLHSVTRFLNSVAHTSDHEIPAFNILVSLRFTSVQYDIVQEG